MSDGSLIDSLSYDAQDKIYRQVGDILSAREISKTLTILQLLSKIIGWTFIVISAFTVLFAQGNFDKAVLSLLWLSSGFLLIYTPNQIYVIRLRKQLSILTKRWGVKREFVPGSSNINSLVKNRKNNKTYVISTVYDWFVGKDWILKVAEHIPRDDEPYSANFDKSFLVHSSDFFNEALESHVTAEYLITNKLPSEWRD